MQGAEAVFRDELKGLGRRKRLRLGKRKSFCQENRIL